MFLVRLHNKEEQRPVALATQQLSCQQNRSLIFLLQVGNQTGNSLFGFSSFNFFTSFFSSINSASFRFNSAWINVNSASCSVLLCSTAFATNSAMTSRCCDNLALTSSCCLRNATSSCCRDFTLEQKHGVDFTI